MSTNPEPAYVAVTPILIELADDLGELHPSLASLFAELRKKLFVDLGVRFPAIALRESTELQEGMYRILINEVPMGSSMVRPAMFLVDETAERLRAKDLDCVHAVNPATRVSSAWVGKEHSAALEDQGLQVISAAQLIAQHAGLLLQRNARMFVKVQAVQDMLDALALEAPALVRTIVPGCVSLLRLTEVLGRLVEEEVSIRDLPSILQTIAESAHPNHSSVRLTEDVRAGMKEYLSNKFSSNGKMLVCYLLDPAIEESIRVSIKTTPENGTYLALEPDIAQEIVQAMRTELDRRAAKSAPPVILTAMDIRRYVRKLFEYEFNPPLVVLSYQELTVELILEPQARISLPS